jgi:NitT/TauT family transport system substrate-binding protein
VSRQRWHGWVGLLVGVLVSSTAAAEDQVSLSLDWIVNGTHAGYYLARDKGLYRDAGLEVAISRGFGSGDTVKRVANGGATFGIADAGAIIAARANEDIPVRIVAMVYDRSSLGLIYLKQSGIKAPKDLEGRAIARTASGASVNMFPGFLKANAIDRAKIREVVVDGALYLPMLMSGQVDAVLEQAINIGRFKEAAAQQGKQAVAMRYSDFGLESYGNAIIAAAATVRDKGDLVRRFTAASLRGIADAIDHPEEAITVLRKSNPEVEAKGALDELAALKETDTTPATRNYGLGHVDPARLTATVDTVTAALSLKRSLPVDQLYAAGFLPSDPIRIGGK